MIYRTLLSISYKDNNTELFMANTWRSSWGYKFGIGFWVGGGVYSLINLILNYRAVPQDKILNYNLIILGAAVLGIIVYSIILAARRSR